MREVRSEIVKDQVIVYLAGHIDSKNSAEVETEIRNAVDRADGKSVVFDAEDLEYISSAGLRVLLSAQKIMNKQGSMTITHVNETVMEIFEVTGFSDILTIE